MGSVNPRTEPVLSNSSDVSGLSATAPLCTAEWPLEWPADPRPVTQAAWALHPLSLSRASVAPSLSAYCNAAHPLRGSSHAMSLSAFPQPPNTCNLSPHKIPTIFFTLGFAFGFCKLPIDSAILPENKHRFSYNFIPHG